MPVGRRYKHVASRFQQWRILPADCKSWLERRDDVPDGGVAGTQQQQQQPPAFASVSASAANVAEERLHRSRLCELARERHKVIQESDYVRNQFIDHQVRKARSKSLGRLLQGLDIEQYRGKSASGVERLHQRAAHARLMVLAAKKLGLSIEEIGKFSEAELRLRLNLPAPAGAGAPEEAAVDAAAEAPATPTLTPPPLLHHQQVHHDGHQQHHQQRPATSRWPDTSRPGSTTVPLQLPRLAPGTAGERRRQSTYPRTARGTATAAGAASTSAGGVGAQLTDRRPRTASARRRVQTDPRCVQLINSLTPRYRPPASARTGDVGAIIRANPSLCRPSTDASGAEQPQKQPRGAPAKGAARRTRREALEMLDNIARRRYYEAGNLATLG